MAVSGPRGSAVTIDPACASFLEAVKASGGKPMFEQTVEEVRALVSGVSQQAGVPPAQVHRVENRTIPGTGGDIAVRIHTPRPSTGSLPIDGTPRSRSACFRPKKRVDTM